MAVDPTQSVVGKTIDAVAAASIVGTIVGWLPVIAAILSIIWFMIQIYESRTFTTWIDSRRIRRHAKKIAKLRAKEKVLSAEILAMETVRSAKVSAMTLMEDVKTEPAMDVVRDRTNEVVGRLESET